MLPTVDQNFTEFTGQTNPFHNEQQMTLDQEIRLPMDQDCDEALNSQTI
jgi:hypothetical protein